MPHPLTERADATLTATQAVASLKRLIALDGPFFPCLDECGHHSCEIERRVLAILGRVR